MRKIYTKEEMADLAMRVIAESYTEHVRTVMINHFTSLSDVKFLKEIRKIVIGELDVRLFAPGMFQIVYDKFKTIQL